MAMDGVSIQVKIGEIGPETAGASLQLWLEALP